MLNIEFSTENNTNSSVNYKEGRVINAIPAGFDVLKTKDGSVYSKDGVPCLVFNFNEVEYSNSVYTIRTYPSGGNIVHSILLSITKENASKIFSLFNGVWKSLGLPGYALNTNMKPNSKTGALPRVEVENTNEYHLMEFIKSIKPETAQELADKFNESLLNAVNRFAEASGGNQVKNLSEAFKAGDLLIHWNYQGKKIIPFTEGGKNENTGYGTNFIFPFTTNKISFNKVEVENEIGKTDFWKIQIDDSYLVEGNKFRKTQPETLETPSDITDILSVAAATAPLEEM